MKLSNAIGCLTCILFIILSAFAILVSYVDSNVVVKGRTPIPVVYDRPSNKIEFVYAVCPTCGEEALATKYELMCRNKECVDYGILIER